MNSRCSRSFFSYNRFLILAFFISAGLVVVTYAFHRVWPFGDMTVLQVDLYHQYAPYIEEMRERIVSGKSLLYSWEGGLGKEFLSQMAYYTTSPVNLLYFLFPERLLPEAIALFIILKTSACSVTFGIFLRSHFGGGLQISKDGSAAKEPASSEERNDLSLTVFGVLYAFCGFVTCYYWNIMWMDTAVLFPLVILGLEKLIFRGGRTLYWAALTLTMIVNFYLAVLVCVFTALIYLVIILSEDAVRKDLHFIVRKTADFAVLSVLSALTAVFILVPVAAALARTEVSNQAFPGFHVYENVFQLLTNHFLGARPAVLARNEDLPNIYSGLLTMMLLPLFWADRQILLRKKILVTLLPVFMLLCACIEPLDFMIHGMHFPANLPHRYTFVYSFVLLVMGYRGYLALAERRAGLRPAVIAAIVYAAVMLTSELVIVPRVQQLDRTLDHMAIMLNLAGMAGYLVVFWWWGLAERQERQGTVLCLRGNGGDNSGTESAQTERQGTVLCLRGNLSDNSGTEPAQTERQGTVLCLRGNLSDNSGTEPAQTENRPLSFLQATPGDNNETQPAQTENRPLSFPHLSLLLILLASVCAEALFTSVRNMELSDSRSKYTMYLDDTADALDYMNKTEDGAFFRTEFRRFATINDASLYHYNGFSQFSSLEPGGIASLMEDLGLAATGNSFRYYDPSPLIDAVFGMKYIMNKNEPYARDDRYTYVDQFGSIFLYENDRVLPLAFLTDPALADWSAEGTNPFEAQNTLLAAASGVKGDMFRITPPTSFSTENMTVTKSAAENDFSYELTEPLNLDARPTVHASFTSERSQYFYLYVDAQNAIRFIYQHGTDRQDRELSAGRSLIDVGWCEAGDVVTVDFELTRRGKFEKTYRKRGDVQLLGAGYDDAVFDEGFRKLAAQPMTIESFSDTKIVGKVGKTGDGSLSLAEEDTKTGDGSLSLTDEDAKTENRPLSLKDDDVKTEDSILFTSIPYSPNWKIYIDGALAESIAVGGDGLLAAKMPPGEHTVMLVYRNRQILPSVITSLLGVFLFLLYRKRKPVTCSPLPHMRNFHPADIRRDSGAHPTS